MRIYDPVTGELLAERPGYIPPEEEARLIEAARAAARHRETMTNIGGIVAETIGAGAGSLGGAVVGWPIVGAGAGAALAGGAYDVATGRGLPGWRTTALRVGLGAGPQMVVEGLGAGGRLARPVLRWGARKFPGIARTVESVWPGALEQAKQARAGVRGGVAKEPIEIGEEIVKGRPATPTALGIKGLKRLYAEHRRRIGNVFERVKRSAAGGTMPTHMGELVAEARALRAEAPWRPPQRVPPGTANIAAKGEAAEASAEKVFQTAAGRGPKVGAATGPQAQATYEQAASNVIDRLLAKAEAEQTLTFAEARDLEVALGKVAAPRSGQLHPDVNQWKADRLLEATRRDLDAALEYLDQGLPGELGAARAEWAAMQRAWKESTLAPYLREREFEKIVFEAFRPGGVTAARELKHALGGPGNPLWDDAVETWFERVIYRPSFVADTFDPAAFVRTVDRYVGQSGGRAVRGDVLREILPPGQYAEVLKTRNMFAAQMRSGAPMAHRAGLVAASALLSGGAEGLRRAFMGTPTGGPQASPLEHLWTPIGVAVGTSLALTPGGRRYLLTPFAPPAAAQAFLREPLAERLRLAPPPP
jgi:hypothetical protein